MDETNFTKASLQTREWSCRYSNLAVDQAQVYTGYRSVIATVSEEKGVDLIEIFDHAINEFNFCRYLGNLSRTNNREPFALFLDNLTCHKTQLVRQMYGKLRITPLYNVPYSPETQPIEACFSQVKRIYNRQRLHCLVNDEVFVRDDVIHQAFGAIEPQHVRNNVRRSMASLTRLNFQV